jgi:hypothetical protein
VKENSVVSDWKIGNKTFMEVVSERTNADVYHREIIMEEVLNNKRK